MTVARATVYPNGSADMTIHLEFIDGNPGYTFAFQLTLAKVPTHSPSSTLTIAQAHDYPLRIVAAASSDLTHVPPIFTGSGSGDTYVTVTVPANVDATEVANSHDGVYEMQASVVLVPDQLYPTDIVSLTSILPGGVFTSAYGLGVSASDMPLNGDLCVVPNQEASIARGYVNHQGPGHVWDYAGRFGAWFLDAAGAHTTADFTGRQIKEFLVGGSDTCVDNAVAKGYNPLLDNCTSYVGGGPAATWVVGDHSITCDPSPLGSWGPAMDHATPPQCCVQDVDYTADTIGFGAVCLDKYLSLYNAPVVQPQPGDSPPGDSTCTAQTTQRMEIACRPEEGKRWAVSYVPTYKPVGTTLYWDPSTGTKWARSFRSDPSIYTQRAYGAAAVCQ